MALGYRNDERTYPSTRLCRFVGVCEGERKIEKNVSVDVRGSCSRFELPIMSALFFDHLWSVAMLVYLEWAVHTQWTEIINSQMMTMEIVQFQRTKFQRDDWIPSGSQFWKNCFQMTTCPHCLSQPDPSSCLKLHMPLSLCSIPLPASCSDTNTFCLFNFKLQISVFSHFRKIKWPNIVSDWTPLAVHTS